MVKRDILYPIFLKCASLCDDVFWREVFEELSYGNGFGGTYISKGCFCSSIKNKEFIYKFMGKPESKIYTDITRILKDKLNIMSNSDRLLMFKEFEHVEKQLRLMRDVEWSLIKKKNWKDILFQGFLINMKKEFSLSDTQIKKIYNFLNLGLILKSIKNSDVIYEDGEIRRIEGIFFSKPSTDEKHGKYELKIDIYSGLDDEGTSKISKKGKKLLKYL